MIDQMSSPVLFVIVFVLLLLVGGGLFLPVRVLGVGQRPTRVGPRRTRARTQQPQRVGTGRHRHRLVDRRPDHDLVLAPVVLAVGLAARRLPAYLRAPAEAGLVVWGSATLLAVPVLGRFGSLDDSPTLLDRPYVVTWLVGCAVTVLLVGVAGAVRSQRGVADA